MEQYNKILVIPDVHGRTFWKGSISGSYDHVVFLGDYLDPYLSERITVRKAHDNFHEILEYKRQHNDQVTLLLGNHDMHYASEQFFDLACGSRYNHEMAPAFKKIYQDNADMFQLAWEAEVGFQRYLFTHAGINRPWYNRHEELIGEVNAENLNRLLSTNDGIAAISDVGYSRGGLDPTGGPMWADVSEMYFSPDFTEFYQILGHTQQIKDPVIEESFACLDCRRAFVVSEKGIFALHTI